MMKVNLVLISILVTYSIGIFNSIGKAYIITYLSIIILSMYNMIYYKIKKYDIKLSLVVVLMNMYLFYKLKDYTNHLAISKLFTFLLINIYFISLKKFFSEKVFFKIEKYFITIVAIKCIYFIIIIFKLNLYPKILFSPEILRYEYSFSFNPIYFARILGISVLLFLINYKKTKNRRYLINILIAMQFMYLTGSRAPVLCLFFIILMYFFSIKKYVIFLPIFGLVGLFFNEKLISFFLRGKEISQSTSGRISLIKESISAFLNNKFLGIGLGEFNKISNIGVSHNLILEILCELGLIGLLLFIYYYIILIKRGKYNVIIYYLLMNDLFSANLSNEFALYIFIWLNYYYSIYYMKGIKNEYIDNKFG